MSERPAWWHGVAVLSCALGMASKEVMVTAPLMVLLYDAVFRSGSFRPLFEKRWPLYLGLAATWTILLALTWSGPRARTVGFSAGASAWDYALNQSVMVTRYLRLAVWPKALVLDYGAPQPTSVLQVWPYLRGRRAHHGRDRDGAGLPPGRWFSRRVVLPDSRTDLQRHTDRRPRLGRRGGCIFRWPLSSS